MSKPALKEAGTVTGIYGSQNFINQKSLSLGTVITLGQKITTGPSSSVEITFDSSDPKGRKTVLKIYENSEFLVEATFLTTPNKFLGKLLKGTIQSVIQNLLPQDHHEIISPNAVTGVRGTRYYIQFFPEEVTTKIHVLEVSPPHKVTAATKGQAPIEVPPQKTVLIVKDQPPILKDLDSSELPKEPIYQRSKKEVSLEDKITEKEISLQGEITDYSDNPIAHATVLGFVEYWTAPENKIQQRQKLIQEWGPSNDTSNRLAMKKLHAGLKEWGIRLSGGNPHWRTQTDGDGKFEISGLPPFNPQTMFDMEYNIIVFKYGFGRPDSPRYHGVDTGPNFHMGDKNTKNNTPNTHFKFSLPKIQSMTEDLSGYSCSMKEETFSGSKLIYEPLLEHDAWITAYLYKQQVTQDEIIRIKNYEGFDRYAPSQKQRYKQKYDEILQKAKTIQTVHWIEAFPIFHKMGTEWWDPTIRIGYQFIPEIHDYLVLKEICEPRSITTLKPEKGRGRKGTFELRVIDPPFEKGIDYFERMERASR